MQIAENVLTKLPSSMLMPETRHLHQMKETRIATSTLEDVTEEEGLNSEGNNAKTAEPDEDLV